MRIGLLGFGTVGQGVYNLTKPREDMEVAWVLCRRELALPDARVTHDFLDILGDASVDTVVEAIGGLHPAREYVMAAMQAGKNVVTANKAMMAEFYDELLPLAQEKGVLLRCTASVGGGIGWLSELERVRRIETVRHVGGIMNGTCNYILDSMTRLGLGYQEALANAQGEGKAEAAQGAARALEGMGRAFGQPSLERLAQSLEEAAPQAQLTALEQASRILRQELLKFQGQEARRLMLNSAPPPRKFRLQTQEYFRQLTNQEPAP